MGLKHRIKKAFLEIRGQPGEISFDDPLLKAILGGYTASKERALQVPTVSGGIDLIASIVAGTPIKLYRDNGGEAEEIFGDIRLRLLNDDTGDTLNASEFWRAMVRDYYLGKGGYAYIERTRGEISGLYYVNEERVSILKNDDPIHKDFTISVAGKTYPPYDFLKLLRNTKDGARGIPITEESSTLIEVAYQSLCFELYLVKKGGNKKGFLKSQKRIDKASMDELRKGFANLYSNSTDNVVVLNDGIEFQESSNTSVEMQLNEQKRSNAEEFAKIFHISSNVMGGNAGENDIASLARLAAVPLMTAIQCALNRDLLLEREKGNLYFAFDTKELLKGDMQSRFSAYKTALDANFMQIDEVRYAEDLEPLGLNWIKLGLQDVLYDPKTKEIYTPNTNQTSVMGAAYRSEKAEEPLQNRGEADTIELRYNKHHDPSNGRFASKGGSTRKGTKGRKTVLRIGKKEQARLSHQILTDFPNLPAGPQVYNYFNRNHFYKFSVQGPGSYLFHRKIAIEGNEEAITKARKDGTNL